ncbi:MAG: DUF2835 domain-containing protein [Gammaproteobacteria bacterium]
MPYNFTVQLSLSVEEVSRYYRGVAQQVVAITEDGRRIRFPARALRSIVTQDGVQGYFTIETDDDFKFLGISRNKN